MESSQPVTPHVVTTLEQLRFSSVARLYLNAAGFDVVQGLAEPSDQFSAAESLSRGVLTLDLRTKSGKTGTISFPLPSTIDEFAVDPSPGSGNAEPVLYKEWRLVARASTTGIFAGASAKGAPQARLILHGKGNGCTDAAQFSSWTLQISGPGAQFTLFGKLGAPAP
jgi:hypothetical protein